MPSSHKNVPDDRSSRESEEELRQSRESREPLISSHFVVPSNQAPLQVRLLILSIALLTGIAIGSKLQRGSIGMPSSSACADQDSQLVLLRKELANAKHECGGTTFLPPLQQPSPPPPLPPPPPPLRLPAPAVAEADAVQPRPVPSVDTVTSAHDVPCPSDTNASFYTSRSAQLMSNVKRTAAEAAAARHSLIGERFAYLRVHANSRISACACPERRFFGTSGYWYTWPADRHRNVTDNWLSPTMSELRALYRAALAASPAASKASTLLPEGSEFVVLLNDFDGNRDHQRARHRDADHKPIVSLLHEAPPPLVIAAFASEHAMAAPTFTYNLTGWGTHFPPNVHAPTTPWAQRKPALQWRGSSGSANYNRGREKLLAAALTRPELIDAHATDGAGGRAHFLTWAQQANYKYVAVTEGVASTPSWRVRAALATGATPFIELKSKGGALEYAQSKSSHSWFSPLLVPRVHFVPVHADFANAVDRVEWARTNDRLAHDIATKSERFAAEQLTPRCAHKALRLILRELSRLERTSRALRDVDGHTMWPCPAGCTFEEDFVPAK